jgi:hypothetical protein
MQPGRRCDEPEVPHTSQLRARYVSTISMRAQTLLLLFREFLEESIQILYIISADFELMAVWT